MLGRSFSPSSAPSPAWQPPSALGRPFSAGAGSNASIAYWGFVILTIGNIALPKAGIEVGTLPVTFGYVLLGLAAPLGLIGLVRRPTLSPAAIGNFIVFLLVGLVVVYKSFAFRVPFSTILPLLVLFIVLPAILLVALCAHLEYLTERQIGGILKWSLRFVIVWGLMNFAMYAAFKHMIEIKYLTVNGGDVASVLEKNNKRGDLMKLVGTYNNGNIFGVCMIMLAPLYIYFEKSRLWVAAFLVAVLLTLSRTSWFGLAAIAGMMVLSGQIRLTRGYFWIAVVASAAVAIGMAAVLGWSSDRVLDTNLGGRLDQWTGLVISPFGERNVLISEILYAGLLRSFGVVGALVALVAFLYPVGYALGRFAELSVLRRAAAVGCAGYLIVAFFDAALLYPPTLAIFLFVSALVYRRGYRLPSGMPLSSARPVAPQT